MQFTRLLYLTLLLALIAPRAAAAWPETQLICTGGTITIAPCDPSATTPVYGSASMQFTITNTSQFQQNYFATTLYTGGVASAYVDPAQVSVGAQSNTTVTVYWTMGSAQTNGTVTLELFDGADTWVTIISITAVGPFTVDLSHNNNDFQHPGLCEAGCFAVRAAHSTAPYFSLGSPRSVTLVYDGDRAHPRPFIRADVAKIPAAPSITYWTLEATLGGTPVTFLNGDTRLYFSPGGEPLRLAGQFDASGYSTGLYSLAVKVGARDANSLDSYTTTTIQIFIVNDAASPIAKGWTVAGLQRLYTSGGYRIVEGGGAAIVFSGLNTAGPDFSILTQSGSNYIRTYLDGTKATFNSSGYQTELTDRLGQTVTFGYDGSNRPTSVGDPVRRYSGSLVSYITLSYGTYGLASVVEPGANHVPGGGRTTSYTVNSGSQLVTITDPDSKTTGFDYDGSSRLWKITDRRGGLHEFVYHSPSWKLSQAKMPQIDIDAGGGSTTTTIPTVTFSAWQNVGVPTTSTSSGSPAAAASLDTIQGRVTDPLSRVTRFTADRWGQPLKIVDHLNRQTVFTRTGMFATTVVRPPGVTDQYAYTNGLLTMSQPAGSAATYFRYGVNAQIDSVWGTGARAERRFLQANGNADSVRMARSGGAEIVRYRYDGSGRLDKVTDHSGDSTTYAYDAGFGNIRRVLVPTGLVDSTFFDGYGRDSVLASTGQPNRTVLYDAVNRATHLYDGVNTNPTLTQYDALYDTTVTDSKSQVYRFHRNPLGWVTREYTANSASVYTSFRYDATGQLTSWTNRRGQRVNLSYDGLGRLITKSGDNTSTDSLSYSEATGVSLFMGKNAFSGDTLYVEEQAGTTTATHGLGGQRFQIVYKTHPSLSTPDTATISCTSCSNGLSFYTRSFHYDTTSGALASLHIGSAVTFFSYGAEMERTTTSYPGFQPRHESYTTSTQRYDSRFDSVAVDQTLRRAYRFDQLGRIERDQREAPNRTIQRSFGYDGLSRLTGAENRTQGCIVWPGGNADSLSAQFGWRYTCSGSTTTESYSYDASGNRTSQSGSYADGNRVTALGVFTFEHDADGNITRRQNSSTGQDRRYYWSAENLLDSVVTVGGDRVGYRYNVMGQPVVRTRNGSVERYFLYDGGNLLAELDASFNRLAEYVHLGTDAPFAMITGSTTPTTIGYHQQDVLGNVSGIHNGSSISQHILYTTWGTPTFQSSTTNRLAWKGLVYEGDGVNLYYMRARWYDPEIGRFISEDPIGLSGGINQYAFAGNDPVNGWDPSGLQSPWVLPNIPITAPLVVTRNYGWLRGVANFLSSLGGRGSVSNAEAGAWQLADDVTAASDATAVADRTASARARRANRQLAGCVRHQAEIGFHAAAAGPMAFGAVSGGMAASRRATAGGIGLGLIVSVAGFPELAPIAFTTGRSSVIAAGALSGAWKAHHAALRPALAVGAANTLECF